MEALGLQPTEAFREEFTDVVEGSLELKLMMSGRGPVSVVRYMVDRGVIKSDGLERVDGILKRTGV